MNPFLTRQEKINAELLEQKGIKPTGYYHYDEQFPHENGEPLVRLALIDAINGLPINDIMAFINNRQPVLQICQGQTVFVIQFHIHLMLLGNRQNQLYHIHCHRRHKYDLQVFVDYVVL